ncbi:nitrilase-related carbon-nitrogen hydrolase [Amycolatopsis sp. NPDC058340]|uniref:nitrilase-related carbon-nitrogen hydrolase n=1 Tax=Amycolatopsis sp. NPDC058340 TaxID=3346453 RepID=UPI00366A3C71
MTVTVAACQTFADVDRPDPGHVERAVRMAVGRGARLVVVPELAVSGSCFADAQEARAAAEPADGVTVGRWWALSAELGCVLVGGYPELGADGAVYNSAVLIDAGRAYHHYRKVHLWGKEKELFTPGSAPPVVADTSVGRVAVMICYDLEIPEWVRTAALAGADLIAAPCNWPLLSRPAGERPIELIKAQAAAAVNKIPIVVADRCGVERGTDWIRGSAVIDQSGYLLTRPGFADDDGGSMVLTADVDPASARDKVLGEYNDAFADRRPGLYTALLKTGADEGNE